MSFEHGKRAGGSVGNAAAAAGGTPGKQTLVDQLYEEPAAETAGSGSGTPAAGPAAGKPGGGAGLKENGITVRTANPAPSSGSHARTKVGVGEEVSFKAPKGGTFTAPAGTSTQKTSGAAQELTWHAPDTNAKVMITYQPGDDKQPAKTVEMEVVAPKEVIFRDTNPMFVATAGAGMQNHVIVGPEDVSFKAAAWNEEGGKAGAPQAVTGYFEAYQRQGGNLNHYPNPEPKAIDDNLADDAAVAGLPKIGGGYAAGSFHWSIPNQYRVGKGPAHPIGAPVVQKFVMKEGGTVTVQKGPDEKVSATQTTAQGGAFSLGTGTEKQKADNLEVVKREGLAMQVNRLKTADEETRKQIFALIKARTPAPVIKLTVTVLNSYSVFTSDKVTAWVNGKQVGSEFKLDKKGAFEVVTLPFLDAFDLPHLLKTKATVNVTAEGNSLDKEIDLIIPTTGALVEKLGSDARYQISYEVQNIGAVAAAPEPAK